MWRRLFKTTLNTTDPPSKTTQPTTDPPHLKQDYTNPISCAWITKTIIFYAVSTGFV